MGDLEIRQSANDETQTTALLDKNVNLDLLVRHINGWEMPDIPAELFFRVGFTHHTEILAKEKSLQGRLYYIAKCAYGSFAHAA
jgi:hypothetical protein